MLQSEFTRRIAEKTGLTKKDVIAVIDAYHEVIIEALKSKDSVMLRNFGTFTTITRKTGINHIAQIVPKFNPAKVVKDAVKENN